MTAHLVRFHPINSCLDGLAQASQTEIASFLLYRTEKLEVRRWHRSKHRQRLFGRGQTVDAEPVLPGWRVDVDWIFA